MTSDQKDMAKVMLITGSVVIFIIGGVVGLVHLDEKDQAVCAAKHCPSPSKPEIVARAGCLCVAAPTD